MRLPASAVRQHGVKEGVVERRGGSRAALGKAIPTVDGAERRAGWVGLEDGEHEGTAGRFVGEDLERPQRPQNSRCVSEEGAVEQRIWRRRGAREIAELEACGIEVPVDVCTYHSPRVRGLQGRVMTNAAKWAYYAPGMLGVEVAFGSLRECVESAIRGEVWRDPNLWSAR